MVLTRFLHLQIWDANNEYIKYDNKTSTNWGITAGTVKLDKILMTDQLNFGEINSSALELQVFGIDEDLSNRKIKLEALDAVVEEKYLVDDDMNRIVTDLGDYIIVDNLNPEHIFPLFCGYIESAEKDYISTDRNIKAYDWLYFHKNDNIAQWWNIWWNAYEDGIIRPTVLLFITDLLSQMGLTTSTVLNQLPNSTVTITNPIKYTIPAHGGLPSTTEYLATEIKFGDIFSMLCKLMNTTAVIDGDFTNIHFFRLQDAETYDLTDNLEKEECKWEDFETDLVTGVGIYDTSNSLAQTVGATDNVYKVSGNLFILNQSASNVENIATAILDDIDNIQYIPCTLKCIVSDLNHKLGDIVHTEKGNSYILGISYSGPLLVEEEIICPASNGRTLSEKVDSYNDSIIEGVKSAVFEKDIDHFKSEFRNTTLGLSSKIEQNTSSINAEVSRAQSQEEIAGVINSYVKVRDPIYEQGELWQHGQICLISDITLLHSLTPGTKIAVWVKDMGESTYNDDYDRYIELGVKNSPSDEYPAIHRLPIYYTNDEPLRTQYKNGVVLRLMYRYNEQFPLGNGRYKYLSGWWVGADDSLARLQITSDSILSYVGNNFVNNTTYDAEIQNLQDQIDGRVEYWDGNVVPTLTNLPASNWTTDADKSSHVGDLYRYHHGTPEVTDYYRFDKDTSTTPATYSWVALGASEVDEALRIANEANTKADAAQSQLDDFEASTAGNFTQVNQTISSVTTTVSGIQKREVQNNTFSATTEAYSTDGIIYKLNVALSDVDTDTRLAILLQSIPWDTTETAKKRYIKINDETTEIGVNTFPVYYSKDTPLTNQLGLGNVLNVKFYTNYNTTGSTTAPAFVVSNNDRTYERLESELSVERGRIVLRAENTSPVSGGGYKGRLAIARLDSTGSSSELYLSADNIKLEAGDGMKLLAGQTLTLSGANGLVINSPNFNVYRDGNVSLTGTVYATSGRFTGEIQSTSGKIGNFNITTNGFSKASSTSGFTLDDTMLYFASGANEANTMSVSAMGISTKGYVKCTSIERRGDRWANINTDLNTTLVNIDNRLVNVTRTVSYLGYYQSADTDGEVSVSSGTNKSIAQIDLDNGIWIIIARTNFASNTTGDRLVMINTSKDSDSGRGQSAVRLDAISGNATQIITTRIVTTGGRYYMTVSQDSGSSLMCSGGITAVRLK